MSKILVPRHRETKISYQARWDLINSPGNGLAFPCDSHGRVRVKALHPKMKAAYEALVSRSESWTREYGKKWIEKKECDYLVPCRVQCDCGNIFDCDPYNSIVGTECPRCGRTYSPAGERKGKTKGGGSMKDRHECPKVYIGSSDIAALIAVGPGGEGLGTRTINFGMDGSYKAYICDEGTEIPSVYRSVFVCDHWLKIYDDEGKSYELDVPGKRIAVLRAGEMGAIIKVYERA